MHATTLSQFLGVIWPVSKLSLFCILLWLVYRIFLKTLRTRLPPGPSGSLIGGVKGLLPRAEPWKCYAQWSQQYSSPAISFRLYNRTTIVLNNLESVTALLSNRSNFYSDRPQSWMYNDICGRGKSVFNIAASSPRHRVYRKILQSGLGKKATYGAQEVINSEAAIFIHGLRTAPVQWLTHVRRNAAGVIMKVAFGYKIESLDDTFIRTAEETSGITSQALTPGRWAVDYFPLLRHLPSFLPGAAWKRQGLAWKDRLNFLSEVPHQWVKQQMKLGSHDESLTSHFLHEISDDPEIKNESREEKEDIVKWCAAALYAGAADTTVSAVTSFILLMALYPDVQKRAQVEVDRELGRHIEEEKVTVDVDMLHNMEYLNATMKEVLRFAPVGNLALPHCASQDDEFMGYIIPKGTTVVANVWAILHDPSIYPKPFTFDPNRFLPRASDHESQMDPTTVAFGFGRRVCPGSYFAATTALNAMACVLAQFDIECEDPAVRRANIEFTTGITSHIKPFPIKFSPRPRST